MAAHGGAAAPEHLVDDAPSEAASWTQRVKKKTHNVADLLNKLKASKAVRKDYRAMVDLKLKKVIIACVLCWTTVSCSNMTTGQCQHDDRCFKRAAAAIPIPTISDGWRHRRAGHAQPLLNLGVETAKRDIYLKANVEETDNMERDNMAPPQETLINIVA